MARGALFPSEHSMRMDAATGVPVHQMTSQSCINHATYFLQCSFSPCGRHLLFTSYRTGGAQLFEAEFPDGRIRQLTDGSGVHAFSPAFHPSGRSILFVRGGSILELDWNTLEERTIASFEGGQLGEISMDRTGEWLTAAIKIGPQAGLVTGRTDGTRWRMIPFARTVIHPQFHPLEPDWIEFAGDPAPRMHRVRRDGTAMECLYEHGNDEFVVHETFLGATGDVVFTVWPRALRRMDWTTREISTVAEFNAWHITPNRDGSLVLCDTNHPDLGLFLIDANTGARRHLCLSESSNQGTQWLTSRYALKEDFERARSGPKTGVVSWMEVQTDTVYGPQWTHPHPSFSRDEKTVVFASDRTGHPQVYAAAITAIL